MPTAPVERTHGAYRPRVLMVLTRPIPDSPHSGRERTLSFIRAALASRCDVATFEIESVAHARSARRAAGIALKLPAGLLAGRPWALQLALFHDGAGLARLLRAIDEHAATAIVFDSVRTTDYLVAVHRRLPSLPLVADFDDLMSLRFERLLARRLPISLGYLEAVVPRWLKGFLQNGWLTRAVLRYEARALRLAERRAVAAASAVTVVSTVDAAHLQASTPAALTSRVHVLPPVVSFTRPDILTRSCDEFLFVGSDSLLQNRLTIEYLLRLWQRLRPATPLRIVGRMKGVYAPCDGVIFAGFVQDLGDLYSDARIALCPSFVEGGIKTKVLEALGQGVVAVGNASTFEGMGCDPGDLLLDEAGLERLVCDPASHVALLVEAARAMRGCVEARYSMAAVTEAWMRLVAPQPPIDQL